MRYADLGPLALAHPMTVSIRARVTEAQFDAILARAPAELHSEAVGRWADRRDLHDELIHVAWLLRKGLE